MSNEGYRSINVSAKSSEEMNHACIRYITLGYSVSSIRSPSLAGNIQNVIIRVHLV